MHCSTLALLIFLLLSSCASSPPAPPEDVAQQILVALEDDQPAQAERLFAQIADQREHREKVYPVIYDAAGEHFSAGDVESATRLLRFMSDVYPDARSVDEALLYALFLERAEQAKPQAALLEEIESTLARLQSGPGDAAPIVDLVATQHAIDIDRLPDARLSFERFLANWDGSEGELITYVEDIDRYLASH